MGTEQIQEIVNNQPDTLLRRIGEKIINRERIFFDEGCNSF